MGDPLQQLRVGQGAGVFDGHSPLPGASGRPRCRSHLLIGLAAAGHDHQAGRLGKDGAG
jgi:hypothetical protein